MIARAKIIRDDPLKKKFFCAEFTKRMSMKREASAKARLIVARDIIIRYDPRKKDLD